MDWQSILGDTATVATISTAIFVVIDFIKKLTGRWKWGKRIPGEVWFGLSIALGVAVAVGVYWDNFFAPGASVGSILSATTYGLFAGAGSKLVNSVAGSAGAKLQAAKEEARVQAAVATGECVPDNPPAFVEDTSTNPVESSCETTAQSEQEVINAVVPHTPIDDYIPKHAARAVLFELVPVVADEPVFLTGPSDDAPNHVLIPAGWRNTNRGD